MCTFTLTYICTERTGRKRTAPAFPHCVVSGGRELRGEAGQLWRIGIGNGLAVVVLFLLDAQEAVDCHFRVLIYEEEVLE